MRIRSRYLILAFASVAALAVSGIAFASHISNTSSLPTWNVGPSELPGSGGGGTGGSGALAPVTLDVQTATVFAHPGDAAQGGKVANVRLDFDNDVVISLAGIPSCTATFSSGTTIADAWEACGPGADTPPEVNAYLSPATIVSGTVSTTPPNNFAGCTLVFKQSATQLLLFARVTFATTADCSSPATNTTGNTTTLLTGTLSSVTTNPDFNRRLNVAVPPSLPLALDNFKVRVRRLSVFRARCVDTSKLLNLRATFGYTNPVASNQPADVVNKTKACT
jgi:hypothetical protein